MQSKPTKDNHVHLRGVLSKETALPLLKKYKDIDLSSIFKDEHKAFLLGNRHLMGLLDKESSIETKANSIFSFSSLVEFFASYLVTAYLFREKEDLTYLINSVVESFVKQGINSADIIASPHQYLVTETMTLDEILKSLSSFNSDKLNVNWVIDPVRDRGEKSCINLIESCHEITPNFFKAINLGGNEEKFPADQFKNLYKRAEELGLELRMHAGETGRVDNLEYAVKELGCKRIGHGISVVKDKELMRYVSDNEIKLEICISSSLILSGYKIDNFPLREIYDAGIKILICTDDPGYLNTNLEREFSKLKDFGFKDNEVQDLVESVNAIS